MMLSMQQFIVSTKAKRVYVDDETGKKRTKTVIVEVPILSPEHIPLLLEKARDDRLNLTIRILIGSGIRYEELIQVNKKTFYPDNQSLRIKSMKKAAVEPDRYVKLSTDGGEAVRLWIEAGYKPMSRIGFYDWMKKIYAATGGLTLTSKSLRKTVEVWRLKAGQLPYDVAESMGHTTRVQAGSYYSNIPFNAEQLEMIKKLVA